jgi:hypothetical protein
VKQGKFRPVEGDYIKKYCKIYRNKIEGLFVDNIKAVPGRSASADSTVY